MEVVIPTIRNLQNLRAWRDMLDGVHVIVIQDGDPKSAIDLPDGINATVWNRDSIEDMLGENSWIISSHDSACRCFGFLVAKARLIYTLDDDCWPPNTGVSIFANPLNGHFHNLSTPSHPAYFNTLFDQAFVRGYPHALRTGVPTAISHGLWLKHPDLDAITQRENPDLRIEDSVDIVQTIPRGVQYSMCGMNVAFNRELIGPAMYFGLMGSGQPWGRYDDLWAGWCSKLVCDHLGYGVKSGMPYVVHEKASNWRANLIREAKGIEWAGDLYRFFDGVKLSAECSTARDCYLEIADRVKIQLGKLDPYFVRLGKAMGIWIDLWDRYAIPESS